MSPKVPIPGSESTRPPECKYIEPLGDDEIVSVSLIVRSPPDSPPVPDLDYWQNTPLSEQRLISADEYVRTYGSSQSDLDKVLEFVEQHGMTVLESNAGRRVVKAQATVKQIHTAFGVVLHRYESPLPRRRAKIHEHKNHIHRSYDGHVYVPENLSVIITAVIGLDNRAVGAPGIPSGDPPYTDYLIAPTVAGYYNFPNAGAADQVIGVIELDPSGYLESDFTNRYFPSMPPGYNKAPTINSVSASIGATNQGAATPSSDEVDVDIAVSATIAQGATVNVYFANWSLSGWLDFLNRVLVPGTEPQPTVLSISWIIFDDSGIGSPTSPGSFTYMMTERLRHLAFQGINVFAITGDWGASDNAGLTPHVGYPGSDPWVTAVGGTVIGNVHGSPPRHDEWVWSDIAIGGGSTGGGSSAIFPIPPYQIAAGITQMKDSSGNVYTNRFVPDIAGMNLMTGFYLNGNPWTGWGTSLVAPLYAGLTAVIRSALGVRLGFLNPTLYALRHVIFRDIKHGNNDPNNGSAYFTAKPGFDCCTGCGSIHGTDFLNAIVKIMFTQRLHLVVDKHTYTLEEVEHVAFYPTAFKVVLEGWPPSAVGTQKPTITGAFSSLTKVDITVGPPVLEFPSKPFTPQRITYTCSVDFTKAAIHTVAHGGVFPRHGDPPIHETLGATITVLGETLVATDAKLKLFTGPDWKNENTGRISGLIYDRFGYFDGFLLVNEEGKEKWFAGEKNAETLLRFAWEKKALISVLDKHHPHSPDSIVLRRLPEF